MISPKEEHILLNAENLFAAKGFDGTSTREIAAKAKVNISMIAYYFGSKEKLYEKIFEFRLNESLAFAREALQNGNLNEWEKLLIIVDRYVERVKTLRRFYQILQREHLRNKNKNILKLIQESKIEFLEVYSVLFNEGALNGIFSENPRIEMVHATVSGTIFSALNNHQLYKIYAKGEAIPDEQYFSELKNHIHTILKNLLGYEA